MWRTVALLLGVALMLSGLARGQEILGDVFAGKLINPEIGVYAIYDLTDKTTGKRFLLRQAVVGKETVKNKDGFWVEVELIPELGFPMVYKMLLTGPASEPGNVHRIMLMEDGGEAKELPVDPAALKGEPPVAGERKSLGVEKIVLAEGEVDAEHFVIDSGSGTGAQSEVWTNNTVRPMGIVRMVTPNGELRLRRFGNGGPDGVSVIKVDPGKESNHPKSNVTVRVEGGQPPPAAPAAAPEKKPESKRKGRKP